MSHKDADAGFLFAIRAKCVVVISRHRLLDAPDTVAARGCASRELTEDMSRRTQRAKEPGRPPFHSLLAR